MTLAAIGLLTVLSLYVQYAGLAFNCYEQYYYYAAVLLTLTIESGFYSTWALYKKRLQLYDAIAKRHFVPLIQSGHVRYCSHFTLPLQQRALVRFEAKHC